MIAVFSALVVHTSFKARKFFDEEVENFIFVKNGKNVQVWGAGDHPLSREAASERSRTQEKSSEAAPERTRVERRRRTPSIQGHAVGPIQDATKYKSSIPGWSENFTDFFLFQGTFFCTSCAKGMIASATIAHEIQFHQKKELYVCPSQSHRSIARTITNTAPLAASASSRDITSARRKFPAVSFNYKLRHRRHTSTCSGTVTRRDWT